MSNVNINNESLKLKVDKTQLAVNVKSDVALLPFTGLSITAFDQYSGVTNTRITDIEHSLSGITGTLTGATNGLSTIGKNIVLGGSLTGNTSINTLTNELLISGGSTVDSTDRHIKLYNDPDFNYGVSEISATSVKIFGTGDGSKMIIGRDQDNSRYGINIDTAAGSDLNVTSNANTSGLYVFDDSTNKYVNVFTDFGVIQVGDDTPNSFYISDNRTGSNQSGVEYAADYSPNFTNRSLVDKGFVSSYVSSQLTGITTSSISGATNGLVVRNKKVVLGGTLTGDTVINLGGGKLTFLDPAYPDYNVQIGQYSFEATIKNSGAIALDATQLFLAAPTGGTLYLVTTNGSVVVTDTKIISSAIAPTLFQTVLGASGLTYSSDYTANFVKRSLPDIAWVTAYTATHTGGGGTITGATNALTVTGNTIQLGGALIKDTAIDGNHILTFGYTTKLNQFYLGAGSSNFGAITTNSTYNYFDYLVSGTVTGRFGTTSTGAAMYGGNANLTPHTVIEAGLNSAHSLKITDNRTSTNQSGIEYNSDYSAHYTPRSLVDKGFVTGITSTLGSPSIRIVTGSTSISLADQTILVDTSLTAISLLLPTSSIPNGKTFTVKDATGNAFFNEITLDATSLNIDGTHDADINTNYGAITVTYSSSLNKYLITSFVN